MKKILWKYQTCSSVQKQFLSLRLLACFCCFSTFFKILKDLFGKDIFGTFQALKTKFGSFQPSYEAKKLTVCSTVLLIFSVKISSVARWISTFRTPVPLRDGPFVVIARPIMYSFLKNAIRILRTMVENLKPTCPNATVVTIFFIFAWSSCRIRPSEQQNSNLRRTSSAISSRSFMASSGLSSYFSMIFSTTAAIFSWNAFKE